MKEAMIEFFIRVGVVICYVLGTAIFLILAWPFLGFFMDYSPRP